MKNLLLPLCLILTFNLFAQRKSAKRDLAFIKIQGAYFYDGHPRQNFSGFNMLNLGWFKVKEKNISGVDLKTIIFNLDQDPGNRVNSPNFQDWNRIRQSFEAEYFYTFKMLGSVNNGLFAGPYASAGFFREKFVPYSPARFAEIQSGLIVGAGGQADYHLKLAKKIFLTISTQITLAELRLGNGRIQNPQVTIKQQRNSFFDFEVLQNQFPLMLGFSFPLRKV